MLSCSNSGEDRDPGEEACALLDEGKIDEAIAVLDKALEKDGENYSLLSIKSTAYAMKAGVDLPNLIIRAYSNRNSEKQFYTISIESINSNEDSESYINYSLNILKIVIDNEPIREDKFKYSVYKIAESIIILSKIDENLDNIISPDEIKLINIETAKKILSNISEAVKEGFSLVSDEKQNEFIKAFNELNNKLNELKSASDSREALITYIEKNKLKQK